MGYRATHEAAWRSVGRSAAMLAALPYERAFPFRCREVVEKRRDARIREVVRLAYETVAYYRERLRAAGVRPEEIRGAADLARIPPTKDADLRADPLAFVSNRRPAERCHELSTSGRSGRPKRYYHDAWSLLMNVAWSERHEVVFSHFVRRRIARRLLVMNVEMSVAAHVHAHYRQRLRWLAGLGPRREWIDLSEPFDRQVEALNRFRPEMIISYGTFIGDFYDHARRRGVRMHRPDLIALGGEGISRDHRRMIEEDFGIPVVMTYQSGESLKIGFECERREFYHLHEDLCHVRILDGSGREVPEGEVGRVHITNLVNRGTLLINYDQGDEGRLVPGGSCACGRKLRRFELVDGRRWPMLRTLDGRQLHFVQAVEALQKRKIVDQVQVIVERPDCWRVLYTRETGPLPDEERAAAQRHIETRAGRGIVVLLEPAERLERTEAGKWVPVLVRCAGEPPYDSA